MKITGLIRRLSFTGFDAIWRLCLVCLLIRIIASFLYCNHLDGEERELVALLNLSSWCLVMVERLFLARVLWGCLQFVIVVFPDHTHLLFLRYTGYLNFINDPFNRVLLLILVHILLLSCLYF